MIIRKAKNYSFKFVAIVLTICLVVSLIPFSVYATDLGSVETQESDHERIVEIEDKREENVKHFLLPDGSYEAIVYTDAVHRKDTNDNWVDIDNRLYDNNKHGYITEDERIIFNKKINKTNREIFSLAENGYKISFSISDSDVKNVNAKLSNHAEKYIPNKKDTVSEQYKKIKEIDNTTVVSYKNIKKNTSYQYEIKADYIKEKIVLDSACDNYIYSFMLELVGLNAHLESDGSISLNDIETQERIYTFPVPFMYDATGLESYEVKYNLDFIGNGKYRLSIEANSDWINDESRVFPVTIDPTIRPDSYVVYDTYTNSSAPTTNYGYSSELWVSPSRTTYIRIDMPTIPGNAIIRSANLYAAYYYYAGVTAGSVNVGAYKVNTSWNEYSWTWSQSQNYSNYGYSSTRMDTQNLSAEKGATSDSPQWVGFDITAATREWNNGTSTNYGIALKYLTSSTNGSVIIKSYESERYNRAYITVSYYTDSSQIIEDGVYWITSKSTIGASGNPRLIDVEGNSTALNTEIQQWDSSDPSVDKYRAQLFYVKYVGEGYYRIYTFSNPNYCLKIDGDGGVDTGDENINPNYTKWSISGSPSSGYTITNWAGSSLSITVPNSITNGEGLELSSKNSNDNNRNKWNFNKFEGYVMSIVVDPGTVGGGSGGTGHGFLMIENCSSEAAIMGFVTVMPEQTITIGTAGNFWGSEGASSSGEAHEGIFYNREAYHFRESNYYQTRVSLSILIDSDDLATINDDYLRNDKYNDWNLWWWGSHNCTWFAMNVWNAVSDWDVDAYQGWGLGHNPWTLASSIKEYSWYTEQIDIPETDWYGYYYYNSSTNIKYFTYVQGDDGAFPSIEED